MSSKSKQETQQRRKPLSATFVAVNARRRVWGCVHRYTLWRARTRKKRICEGCDEQQTEYINETLHDDYDDIW